MSQELDTLRQENEQLRRELEQLRSQRSAEVKHFDGKNTFNLNLDKLDDMVCAVSASGEILYANKALTDACSLNLEENRPKIYELQGMQCIEKDFADRLEKMRTEGSMTYRWDYHDPKGLRSGVRQVSSFLVNNDGEEVLWFFISDISKLVSSRDDLKDMSELLNVVLDNVPVCVFVKDVDDDFRYLFWNKSFAELSKIPAEKVIGNTDFDVFPAYVDAMKFRQDDMELVRTGKSFHTQETYETASGDIRIVQTYKTLIPRVGRGPLLIGVTTDMTSIKDVEQELVRERIRAEQNDRLKSAFLANMSHEIRTPLNAIVGFSSLLAETEDAASRAAFSEIITQNSELLLQLINDILDLSKIEAGTLEYVRRPMDLHELMRGVYVSQASRTQPGVSLIYDNAINQKSVVINEDHNRIMQVVTNLVSNAIKFTPRGIIRMGFDIQKDIIEVYVSDTGIGIAPEKIDSVFDRFVKLNATAQGTGLGLAICKVIIESIGGKIWVESKLGEGTTFKFTIPFKTVVNSDKKVKKDADGLLPYNMDTLLIAERGDGISQMLKNMLGKRYNLLHAKDGNEAVAMFRRHRPALVLLEVNLPKMNGLETTRTIRRYSSSVPVVVFSDFSFDNDSTLAGDAGVTEYVLKPINKSNLLDIIEKYTAIE